MQDGQGDREKNRKRGLLRGNIKRRTVEERRQIRAAVAAWKFSDPRHRDPPTLQGLGDVLGVSRSTVVECKRRLPNTLEEFLYLCRGNTLPHVMKAIDNLVAKGWRSRETEKASKMLLDRHRLEAKRKQPKAEIPETPDHIQRAFDNYRRGKETPGDGGKAGRKQTS
jgi:hypothetical protein